MKKKHDLSTDEEIDEALIDVSNLASAGDCTGLITHGITDESEIDAYQELYPFLPPIIKQKKEDEGD